LLLRGSCSNPGTRRPAERGKLNCGEEESDTSSEYPPHNIPQFLFERTFNGK